MPLYKSVFPVRSITREATYEVMVLDGAGAAAPTPSDVYNPLEASVVRNGVGDYEVTLGVLTGNASLIIPFTQLNSASTFFISTGPSASDNSFGISVQDETGTPQDLTNQSQLLVLVMIPRTDIL